MPQSEWEARQAREARKALILAALGWFALGLIVGLAAIGAWTLIDALGRTVCA